MTPEEKWAKQMAGKLKLAPEPENPDFFMERLSDLQWDIAKLSEAGSSLIRLINYQDDKIKKLEAEIAFIKGHLVI